MVSTSAVARPHPARSLRRTTRLNPTEKVSDKKNSSSTVQYILGQGPRTDVSKNRFQLNDPAVSGNHGVLSINPLKITFTDLRSRNGSRIGDLEIPTKPKVLTAGAETQILPGKDYLILGNSTIGFYHNKGQRYIVISTYEHGTRNVLETKKFLIDNSSKLKEF